MVRVSRTLGAGKKNRWCGEKEQMVRDEEGFKKNIRCGKKNIALTLVLYWLIMEQMRGESDETRAKLFRNQKKHRCKGE